MKNNKKIKIILFMALIVSLINTSLSGMEYFKGYSSTGKEPVHSIYNLLKSKYGEGSGWNENYFHEAQFKDLGMTIFVNIIFSDAFIGKKGGKLNCIITFKDRSKLTINKDFGQDDFYISNNKFLIKLGKNTFELDKNNYKIYINENDIKLNMNYKIVNPPHIFGDGVLSIDSNNMLYYSQPIVGAQVTGVFSYRNENFRLMGRGSLDHDYNAIKPLKIPRKCRSFWFYNDEYSVSIHTIILTNDKQIDRVVIYKNGNLLKSFLNTGLLTNDYIYDSKTLFKYPGSFIISHTDSNQNRISAKIKLISLTDKIQSFAELSPVIHKIVANTVGEMWAYRFWAEGKFEFVINGKKEIINLVGVGDFVDVVK